MLKYFGNRSFYYAFSRHDQEEDDDFTDEESLPEEELEALLEKDIEAQKKAGEERPAVPVIERTKFRLIDKGKNHFDVLPPGWIVVEHNSGMPVYLHRYSRSVTLSKPYHLGSASARVMHFKIIRVEIFTSC